MSDNKLSIIIISKGEIRSGNLPNFEDPDGIAVMTAEKRRAVLENPLSNSDDDPALILGLSGNIAIGRFDLFPGEVELDGNATPIVWGSALYVSEKHRHTGIGLMLILRMQSVAPAVGVLGVSQAALPLYRSLRWTEVGLPRYVLVRRSRAFIAAFLRSDRLARLLAPFADVIFAAWRFRIRRRIDKLSRSYTVVSLSKMPDHLTPRPVPVPRAMPHRSPKWMNWLLRNSFGDDPSLRKALFMITKHGSDTPLGYFLLKKRRFTEITRWQIRNVTIGSVQDWITFDPSSLPESDVLVLAITECMQRDVDAVEICTKEPGIETTLRRWGLIAMSDLNFFYKANPASPLADPLWREPRHWWLRPAEGDNFFS